MNLEEMSEKKEMAQYEIYKILEKLVSETGARVVMAELVIHRLERMGGSEEIAYGPFKIRLEIP